MTDLIAGFAWVDFNDVHDDHLCTLKKFYEGQSIWALQPGNKLLLGDNDGNRCMGTIVSVEDDVVDLLLDRSTWYEGEQS